LTNVFSITLMCGINTLFFQSVPWPMYFPSHSCVISIPCFSSQFLDPCVSITLMCDQYPGFVQSVPWPMCIPSYSCVVSIPCFSSQFLASCISITLMTCVASIHYFPSHFHGQCVFHHAHAWYMYQYPDFPVSSFTNVFSIVLMCGINTLIFQSFSWSMYFPSYSCVVSIQYVPCFFSSQFLDQCVFHHTHVWYQYLVFPVSSLTNFFSITLMCGIVAGPLEGFILELETRRLKRKLNFQFICVYAWVWDQNTRAWTLLKYSLASHYSTSPSYFHLSS
jgi:hypothetical protein